MGEEKCANMKKKNNTNSLAGKKEHRFFVNNNCVLKAKVNILLLLLQHSRGFQKN